VIEAVPCSVKFVTATEKRPSWRIVSPVHAHRTLLHAVAAQRHSGEQAYVFKGAVVFVVVEKIWACIVRDVEVGPAVVVVVAQVAPRP